MRFPAPKSYAGQFLVTMFLPIVVLIWAIGECFETVPDR